jgi:hypothetical protein
VIVAYSAPDVVTLTEVASEVDAWLGRRVTSFEVTLAFQASTSALLAVTNAPGGGTQGPVQPPQVPSIRTSEMIAPGGKRHVMRAPDNDGERQGSSSEPKPVEGTPLPKMRGSLLAVISTESARPEAAVGGPTSAADLFQRAREVPRSASTLSANSANPGQRRPATHAGYTGTGRWRRRRRDGRNRRCRW